MPIKILLVDDHTVVRSGLSKFLMVNKEFKLVGEASDGAEAVQMVSLHKPDVVLMDLMMPGTDGITATREIHQKYPKVKVIALTSFAEQNMVQGALQAGAIGYLQKNVTAKELGHAIRSAYEGKMTLSPEATQVLANSVAQPQIPGEQLTEREPTYSNAWWMDSTTTRLRKGLSSVLARSNFTSRTSSTNSASIAAWKPSNWQ
jgi:NarL family two-component system response regulator LiaR